MLIRYANGRTLQAVVLSEDAHSMRVAVQGAADAVEFTEINGTWISEECEPVQIQFEWERSVPESVTEEDCICPKELAARLIQLLVAGDEDDCDVELDAPAMINLYPVIVHRVM